MAGEHLSQVSVLVSSQMQRDQTGQAEEKVPEAPFSAGVRLLPTFMEQL